MGEGTMELLVTGRDATSEGTVVLDLAQADGAPLPGFEPGAHVDLHIAPGLVRQYSLCGDPADRARYRLGILLDPASRGGSAGVHAGIGLGSRVRIGRPRNQFRLDPTTRCAVLVGGGIGITPLLAMAHALHAAGRAFMLHYCVRSRSRAAFLAELSAAPFRDQTRLHLDDGPPEQRFDPMRDLPPPAQDVHLYMCGPDGFMAWLGAAARSRGYGEAAIRSERFTAAVTTDGAEFEVVLARSGRTVTVAPSQTIVQALATVGAFIEVSCAQGICGTCLTDVLDGTPDHRDQYLTEAEKAAGDQILPCCSRAASARLVLDR